MNINNINSTKFKAIPTQNTIERDRKIKRDNTFVILGSTCLGTAIGSIKSANKIKTGAIGGITGFIVGNLLSFLIHPRKYND